MRPQELNYFFRNISSLRGVGPKTTKLLGNLFARDEPVFRDMLTHLPAGVISRFMEPSLLLAPEGVECAVTVTVNKVKHRRMGRRNLYTISCSNKSGMLDIVYFNAFPDQITATYREGSMVAVAGKIERFRGKTQMAHPTQVARSIEMIPQHEPVYPLTLGISNRMLRRISGEVVSHLPVLTEWNDAEFLKSNSMPSFSAALKYVHNPDSPQAAGIDTKARQRLAYDELLASQLALALSRRAVTKQKGAAIKTNGSYIKQLLARLPFTLTEGQKNILKEVRADISSGNRMFRMLQGDVGSGKTVVAIAAMLDVVEAGYQCAFMLPTEILAKQQYDVVSKLMKGSNIKTCLLTGKLKAAEKKRLHEEIAAGEYDIIVGTHALLQEGVSFKKLAFITIDEQHRFGVKQRMELAQKGHNTHLLLMSATPIPRTLAMTVYGDLEVSTLREKPAGRKVIDTRTVPLARMDEVIEGLKRAIQKGDRAYWVCPLIEPMEDAEKEEADENASAVMRHKMLAKLFGDKVELVHGRMKTAEKDAAIEKFRSGEANILVATTVIEVGVDVPEASIMVIESAERFGLAQLHQLRGRVGRGDKASSCILLYGDVGENGRKRLGVLRETDDGFKIAEEDLVLRGSGDLTGTKQSGFPEFFFALLPEHREMLFAARDDVKIILERDPYLKGERGKALRLLLYFFEYEKQVENLNA